MTMEDNQIAYIEPGALDGLINLQYLDLSKNNLSTIGKYTFLKLAELQVLMLEFNPWISIEPFAFDGLRSIQIIFLNRQEQYWKGSKMALNSFHDLNNLQILNTDDHRICCLLPNPETTCNRETIPPLFDNCDKHLMPTYAERTLLWIFSICALCGNTYVIVLRCREKNVRNQTQSILILNLAVSDLLMGFYMMIIAIADLHYGKEFVLYAKEWTSSGFCKLAGLISFLSSEASVLFVVLISLDRVLCVGLPHGKKRMTSQTARHASTFVWIVVVSLGIIAIILQETTTTYGLANVCVGLPLVSNKVYRTVYQSEKSGLVGTAGEKVNLTTYEIVESGDTWQFSIAINLGLNCVAFFFVLGCYVAIGIIVATKLPSKNFQRKKDRNQELKLAARMAVIVLTDFFCWMPVIILGILVQSEAIDDTKIRHNYGWIVALVLPLNAALNPYLYTFATEMRNRKRQSTKDIVMEPNNVGNAKGNTLITSRL
ncbi:G-protein coupled receptor GRL101-like [Amphiura filiformis]|uniref:G-protein coupled receptor GRL101-like n=1 Tax=Amphiura filiformis TaxID=82378 RepID=UPI003B20C1B8